MRASTPQPGLDDGWHEAKQQRLCCASPTRGARAQVGFSEANLRSLCDVGRSTKSKVLGFIGQKVRGTRVRPGSEAMGPCALASVRLSRRGLWPARDLCLSCAGADAGHRLQERLPGECAWSLAPPTHGPSRSLALLRAQQQQLSFCLAPLLVPGAAASTMARCEPPLQAMNTINRCTPTRAACAEMRFVI